MWYRKYKEDPVYQKLLSIREEIAKAAQPVYDSWDEEYKEVIGSGGICNEIAEQIYYVVARYFPKYETRTITQESPNHELVLLIPIEDYDERDDSESLSGFEIDIPHNVYEIYNGEYNWDKKEGVTFNADCVSIEPVEIAKENIE